MNYLMKVTRVVADLVGAKILVLVLVICGSVLFEGLGISLFLPILEGESAETQVSQTIRSVFEAVGIPFGLGNLLIVMVVLFLARSLLMVFQATFISWVTTQLAIQLRHDFCRDILNADYPYLLRQNVGHLTNTVVRELHAVVFAVREYANIMVKVGFCLMYVAVPLWLSPLLSLSIVAVGVPVFFLMQRLNAMIRSYSAERTAHSADLQSLLGQTFGFFKYLKATESQQLLLERIHDRSQLLGRTAHRGTVIGAVAQNAFEPLGVLVLAALLYHEVEIAGKQILEVGFVIYLLRRAISSLLATQQHYAKLCHAAGGLDVYLTVKAELEAIQGAEPTRPLVRPDLSGTIRFESVDFEYVPGKPVLRDVSFAIEPLKTTAFIGASGVGKSTVVDLMTGILRPTGGRITIGEGDYRDVDLSALRRRVGYITQEDVIFNDTIANNITLWGDARLADMEASARLAGISPFIEGTAERYDSRLGDRGIMASGGQRQRLMIARELYKKSDILILDEATSALDSDTEEQIRLNLDSLQGEKTIVVIAHRLSTIRNADMVYVLRDGQVVEQGSYDDLRRQEGEFSRLLAQQGIESTVPASVVSAQNSG